MTALQNIVRALGLALMVHGTVPVFAQEPVAFDEKLVHPTRILVRTKPGRAPAAVAGKPLSRRPALAARLSVLDEAHGPQAALPAEGAAARLRARLAALRASGDYEYVEPDYVMEPDELPGDAAIADGRLWGLANVSYPGIDVNAVNAWGLTVGSTNVIVAVIDTGIRYTHQDLATQMWRNPNEVPGNGLDDDHNGYVDDVFGIDAIYGTGNPFDTAGHGTHVAGTIGAGANNGHPHVGVAWNVRLMACKFLGARGGYTSDGIEAINYAVRHGARIINASWGSTSYSQALYDTIASARDAGVLFVAAAGNSRSDFTRLKHYPSGYELDNIISVAAMDRTGALAAFSNYGSQRVHLGAPGVEIFSSYSGFDSDYRYLNGTSMAAPHVAGVAALVWGYYPARPISEVRRRLLISAAPTPSLSGKTVTGGRIDAYGALTVAQDGFLEGVVSLVGNTRLLAGDNCTIAVQVSDLQGITNATVTGAVGHGPALTLRNDGVPPDSCASDDVYTASLIVPSNQPNLLVNVSIVAPGYNETNIQTSFPVVIRPANDDFSSRIYLSGSSNTIAGNNELATRELAEPLHAGLPGHHSLWWSWIAPGNGRAQLSRISGTLDYQTAVYTGATVDALTVVAASDLAIPFFPVRGGETYHIAIDGYRSSAGEFEFSLVYANNSLPGPPNNAFALRQPLVGLKPSAVGLNSSANSEPLEPVHPGARNRSVWWTWTAPVDSRVTLDTAGTEFGIAVAIYLGNVLHELTPLLESMSSTTSGMPRLVFNAAAGREYQILVDSQSNRTGTINFTIDAIPHMRPANDDFHSRLLLGNLPLTLSGNLAGATVEHREPRVEGGTVWWRWQATESGTALAVINSPGSDASVAVYSGNALAGLTRIDFQMEDGRVGWRTSAGQEYAIAVAGPEASFDLSLSPAQAPVFLSMPKDRKVMTGRTIRLVAETTGKSPLYHQWFHNGQSIPGQTNATLVILPAALNDGGEYTLVVSNAFGSITSLPAKVAVDPFVPSVGVFSDHRFVDPGVDPLAGGEPAYLRPAIERIGYPASWITNAEEISVSALVIANQRYGSIATDLNPEARNAIVDFVRDGGLLLVTGSFYERDAELLQSLFEIPVQGINSTTISQFYFRTLQAEGTPFAEVPSPIESFAHTTLDATSLPANAISLYQREDRTLAALLPHGDGAIVYLGPLFLGLRPLGSIDGGWLGLIEAALRVGAPPLDRPPALDGPPESQFVAAGTAVATSIGAYGSQPLTYQWYRGESLVPLATNAVLTLTEVTANSGGAYYVVVSNSFGVTTSEVARIVIPGSDQRITVFDHPAFVNTDGGATDESDAVQATVRYLGYTVDLVTNLSLLPTRVVLIPSIAKGPLSEALSIAELSALSNHVAAGGTLVVHGDRDGHGLSLLQRLFGWELENGRAEAYVYCYRQDVSRRTFFRNCPDIIFSQEGCYSLGPDTLPPGAVVPHLDGDDRAILAEMPWLRGKVIYLGWNWNNAVPLGSRDGGWLMVLGAALAEGWSPAPYPILSISQANQKAHLEAQGTPLAEANLEISSDLATWTSVATNVVPASGVLRLRLESAPNKNFYRIQER